MRYWFDQLDTGGLGTFMQFFVTEITKCLNPTQCYLDFSIRDVILMSCCLLSQDEIDFEFLGKHPQGVQTNYYVNGQVRPFWIPSSFCVVPREQGPPVFDSAQLFTRYFGSRR